MSPGRKAAFEILCLVEDGAYASDLLRGRTAELKSPDAGLASEIVFGVLRFQAQIDFLIGHYSHRTAQKLDREVRIALRMGIYQLRYLDRIPRHAAVDESVELVKLARKRSATGLVNAVLRKVDHQPAAWPDLATELSHPNWLLESWRKQFGAEAAAGIAQAFLKQPETYIRVPASRRAEAEALAIEETGISGCYRLLSGDAGPFRRQDISAQSVVGLLELEPDHKFLDLCAAPGNKTAQALETSPWAVACDFSFNRLLPLDSLAANLVVLDGTEPLPFRGNFDRILVDAPCSGTGTLGRNPEIKWRIQPYDLARHHARQVMLLRNAISNLSPGGRLVYSTCSLEYEENEQVVEEVLEFAPEQIRLDLMVRRVPGVDAGDGFFAAVLTSE